MKLILSFYLRNKPSCAEVVINNGSEVIGNVLDDLLLIGKLNYNDALNRYSLIYLGIDSIYDFFYGTNLYIQVYPLSKL